MLGSVCPGPVIPSFLQLRSLLATGYERLRGLLLTSVVASSMLPFRSRMGMRGGQGLVEMTVVARGREEALCKVFLGLGTFTGQ